MVLGKHRDLQRITVPYARLLGVLEGGGEAMVTDGYVELRFFERGVLGACERLSVLSYYHEHEHGK